ncbi:MAG TPA: hypothetical protein VG897_01240 [Terriglobales bacterium]|nr:hypothetical protein [Terriglobales bacterium]
MIETKYRELLFRVVLSLALGAAILFAIPVFIDRPSYTKAVTNYVKNPTPATESKLQEERVEIQKEISIRM